MAKLHPHLKAFIRGIILTEMGSDDEHSPKKQAWKEEVLSNCIEELVSKIDTIQTEEQYRVFISNIVSELKERMDRMIDSIMVTLNGIPLVVIKNISHIMNPNKTK